MVTRITCIIVDDEPSKGSVLEKNLMEREDVNVLDTISDPANAVSSIFKHKPDIIFMDILMPGKGGFELIEELHQKQYEGSEIIFITEYDAFATKAFEYAAFDYLLKPVETSRLRVTLDRFRTGKKELLQGRTKRLLSMLNEKVFPTRKGLVVIEPIDIVYAEADEEITCLYFKNRRQEIILQSIDVLEESLNSSLFVRIAENVIINLKALTKIELSNNLCYMNMEGQKIKLHIDPDKLDRLSMWK